MSEPTTAEVIERRSFNFLSWLTGLVVGAYVAAYPFHSPTVGDPVYGAPIVTCSDGTA